MRLQTAFHRALILILPLLLAASAQAVNVTVTSPSTTTATVPTNPTIVANASSGYPITAWYVYVDSKAAWNTTVDTSSISAPLTLTVGKHTVLVRAWDSSGAYGTTTLTLTASTTASPGTVTVSIASPTNNATVAQPFTLNASATGGTVHGWYVYSDNVAVANGSGSTASPSLRLAAGTHRLLARFWNTAGTHGDAWLTVNVAASASAPTPPSNAVVFDKIEDMTGWGHCTTCAANPADPTPPLADYTFTQFQSTPSSDGSSVMFWIGGTDAYADALHWKKFGAQNAYHNFIWEFWIYGKSDSLKAQNLEFDIFQAVGGLKYMWGSQCNYKKGIWQTWNYVDKWLDTTIPCTKFQPGVWTRVIWYVQRTSDNRLKYISLTVGNTTYTLNQYQTPSSTTWSDTLGVQFQQDMDSIPDPYYLWADKVKLSMW